MFGKRNIAIYGAGGLGREVACLIQAINADHFIPVWNLIGFFDDFVEKGAAIGNFGISLGGIDELNRWDRPLALCIAVGDSAVVENIVGQIDNPKLRFPNIIHPDFVCTDKKGGVKMGVGNIIMSGCAVTTDVRIGDFNLLNGSVVLGHDVAAGDYNIFMAGARISGMVSIGNRNLFGVNSCVLPKIKVKNGTRIGAGSVLMTQPKEGALYLGVPAKKTQLF